MSKQPKTEDFGLTRAADQLIRLIREGTRDMQLKTFEADGFCFDGQKEGGLPEVVFQTSRGLVRWKFPNWEAVLELSSCLSKMRLNHDRALKDPMREFMESVAENKPKLSRR
jgi:hypothetical protein